MALEFFDEIGGIPCIQRVHHMLYDKLFSHFWLKKFFIGIPRDALEDQQTDFMADLFGRPARYCGRAPMRAHQHLFITEEIFMVRHSLLAETLTEAKIAGAHKKRWLEFDLGMKAAIIKKTPEECEGRYRTEEVIVIPKP